MYFAIDYENVGNNGMKGSEYLSEGDIVELFFSDAGPTISQGIFENMENAKCRLLICKLQNQRKNALDFYIATRLGEMIGGGYQESIAIISNDKGFKAVQEYWRECSEPKRRILLAGTITEGIIAANRADERTRMLRHQEKIVNIEVEYARYEEARRIRKLLEEQFHDTEYAAHLEKIEEVYKHRDNKKVLYLDSLKCFGRKDGVQIYNRMKQIIEGDSHDRFECEDTGSEK